MVRIITTLLLLALSTCGAPPQPAGTTAAKSPDPAPGTVSVHMGGEFQALYGVRSSVR